MDEYTVAIAGEDLDVDNLIGQLSELSPISIDRKGEDRFVGLGRRRRKAKGRHEESYVRFDCVWDLSLPLLEYLDREGIAVGKAGIERVVISGLLERGSQLGGELSEEEIRLMGKIGASFCWNIMLIED